MWGKLVSALVAAVAAKMPHVIGDLWDRFKPKSKTTPSGPADSAPVGTPPPADAAPEQPDPEGDDDEQADPDLAEHEPERVRETTARFRCAPAGGEYLIDERGKCACGEGKVVGRSWISRRWPPATGGAYVYVTRKRDDRTGYVEWRPKLREAGEYVVAVCVPATSNRTAKAIYIVNTATKPVRIELDQRGYIKDHIMRWQTLGRWQLDPATAWVKLLNSGGHSEGADALGMRKVG